jgi:hypothetical protein
MPSVYNLLPSQAYFDTVNFSPATTSIVTFEDNINYITQLDEYGFIISNQNELENFVLGSDGRTKPSFSDTVNPNTGNSGLYSEANNVHSVFDMFEPASTTKVIQVAGWGIETISGIDYQLKRDSYTLPHKSYKPRYVIDGDGTVVVPSALWMSTSSPNVERWWVNLLRFNRNSIIFGIKHKDILEISNLSNFIKSKITNSTYVDANNIVVDNDGGVIGTWGVGRLRSHYFGTDSADDVESIDSQIKTIFDECNLLNPDVKLGAISAKDFEKHLAETFISNI